MEQKKLEQQQPAALAPENGQALEPEQLDKVAGGLSNWELGFHEPR